MKSFAGFDDWIEIFKGGNQTDSNGITHDGDALIDNAIKTFDLSQHEPPLVAGHPKDNAPAYGWVSELKKTGSSLFAKFKDVVPEFAQAVKDGLFRKRSASFYNDGRLRHVGFLGAVPPAVKGLKDLVFSCEDPSVTFEFSDTNPWIWQTIADTFRRLREWIIEKEGKDAADTIISNWAIDDIEAEKVNSQAAQKKEETMKFKEFLEVFKFWKGFEKDLDSDLPDFSPFRSQNDQKTFSEADLQQAKKEAAESERKKAEMEFAEKQRVAKREAAQKEISTYCDQLVSSGKIPPSWIDSGLSEFMQSLDSEKEASFSEKGEKKTGLQWFKDFLDGFGKSKLFEELVTKGKAGDSAEFAEGKEDQALGESIAAKVEPKE